MKRFKAAIASEGGSYSAVGMTYDKQNTHHYYQQYNYDLAQTYDQYYTAYAEEQQVTGEIAESIINVFSSINNFLSYLVASTQYVLVLFELITSNGKNYKCLFCVFNPTVLYHDKYKLNSIFITQNCYEMNSQRKHTLIAEFVRQGGLNRFELC